jgi:hypothetical protein
MSIEYIIKGVKVNISEEEYARIMTAEDTERRMQIQRKYDRARDELKAPEGMFAVCVWDPSNPEKSIPYIVDTETTSRKAIYASKKYACWYACMRNKKWFEWLQEQQRKGESVRGETDYVVIDDRGLRV